MNEVFGTPAVIIGVAALLVAVMVGLSKVLDELAENHPNIYRWVTGGCTVGIFVLFVIDAFFVSIGASEFAVALFLVPFWVHAFWLRKDHLSLKRQNKDRA